MFKKITSNRPPDTSLWEAIHGEFSGYIDGGLLRVRRFLEARPRTVFYAMLVCILVSIGCFFFIPKKKAPSKTEAALSVQRPLLDGVGGIATGISSLKELLEINAVLDGLLEKETLNHEDSLVLQQAFDRMLQLEKQLGDTARNQTLP